MLAGELDGGGIGVRGAGGKRVRARRVFRRVLLGRQDVSMTYMSAPGYG